MQSCIFCERPETEIIAENKLALVFFDKYPVNRGHVLVVPKRHVETLFNADWQEVIAINKLIFEVKDILQSRFNPDGFNIGVNVGQAAGQTIFHLHYHIIPRFAGDVENPRGGIRNIKQSLVPYLEGGELP